MKLPLFIARRYLFSRKEKTVINLISWISLVGILVSTVALVVVMSVYNGIGELTQSLFNVFDPELLVEPAEGKTFHTGDIDYDGLVAAEGVAGVSQIVEENAWITVRQSEAIVQLRGVDEGYGRACGLDTMLVDGEYVTRGKAVSCLYGGRGLDGGASFDGAFSDGSADCADGAFDGADAFDGSDGGASFGGSAAFGGMSGEAAVLGEGSFVGGTADHGMAAARGDGATRNVDYLILGWNIMARLGVNSLSSMPLAVHIPKRGTTSIGFSIDEAFNNGYAYTAGTFRIQEEIDDLYVVADIDFVRRLMSYDGDEVTALAFTLDGTKKTAAVKKAIQKRLGPDFTVKDRFEQKPLYYKIFRSERLGVFLILSLIVLISTLNLFSSLSLLIINKRGDIFTLKAMGMERKDMRLSFFSEGMLIAFLGVAAGLLLGFVACLLQQHFGIVKLGGNAIVDAFPVSMRVVDFVSIFLVVVFLSSLVVSLTVRHAKL